MASRKVWEQREARWQRLYGRTPSRPLPSDATHAACDAVVATPDCVHGYHNACPFLLDYLGTERECECACHPRGGE